MQKFHVDPTITTPGICFSPDDNQFYIRGKSSPEDVRTLYYPVLEWIRQFIQEVMEGKYPGFTSENPIRFQMDFTYFNSSSAKFIYDILLELKKFAAAGYPVKVEWLYEEEDIDMKEAGSDTSMLVEMDFDLISKPSVES
jgi:hypothetical protein